MPARQPGSPGRQCTGAISAFVDGIDSHIILPMIRESKKLNFIVIKIKRPCRKKKKKTQCHGVTNINKPKKLMREKQENNLFMHSNSDTLVTPICIIKL